MLSGIVTEYKRPELNIALRAKNLDDIGKKIYHEAKIHGVGVGDSLL